MANNVTIALDAMGGDFAPEIVIKGAHIALTRYPDTKFLIFGDEKKITPLLKRTKLLKQASDIIHTDDIVTSDMKPSLALRQGLKSSMGLSIKAVAEGQAEGIVSAGNTGALMVLSRFILKMLAGVDRPAIATLIPSLAGETVVLDLGANVECAVHNYVQFAVMGALFAKTLLAQIEPSIGLVNVGEEDIKGNDTLREAHHILQNIALPGLYQGFIEGNDILEGAVNVAVMDGFTGNVALKTIEGASRLMSEFIRQAFYSSWPAKVGYVFAKRALNKMKLRFDSRSYNGAVLLGVNGIVVKSHGGTDELGFANAVGVTIDMVAKSYNERVRTLFEALNVSDQFFKKEKTS